MAKKFSKEELQQDPLINTYAKIQQFYFENKTIIISSAVAIILAIGLAIGYHYYQKSLNKKAQALMGTAETYFLKGNYKKALHGSKEELTVGFEQIIANYADTKAGNLAYYYAAASEYQLGNTQKALGYISKYNVPNGILGVAPLSFHAVLLTEAGKFAQAAKTYVKAAEWDKNKSTTPYNYLHAAQAYQEAGNLAQAKKYAQLVINEYGTSAQVPEAKKLLGVLPSNK